MFYFRDGRKVQCSAPPGRLFQNSLEKGTENLEPGQLQVGITRQNQPHRLLWLQFALYENDDQMISYRCYIRNLRSLLEKILETTSFQKDRTLPCTFLARYNSLIAHRCPIWHKSQPSEAARAMAPKLPSCCPFPCRGLSQPVPHAGLAKEQVLSCWGEHLPGSYIKQVLQLV